MSDAVVGRIYLSGSTFLLSDVTAVILDPPMVVLDFARADSVDRNIVKLAVTSGEARMVHYYFGDTAVNERKMNILECIATAFEDGDSPDCQ